ncbi:hypothetical protein [Streptomyces sp. NPDC059928]|uniref:hypothetical protein n=1 Tax=unclassified Streptomyces TaxID=2593676 RepID=UPI003657A21B
MRVEAEGMGSGDVAVLEAVAEGADERELLRRGHFPSVVDTFRGVAALGRMLNGGVPIRWTGTVHLSVVHGVIAAGRRPSVWLSPFQRDLLRAWAKGLSLETYAYEAELSTADAWERSQFLCMRLKASGAQQAVLRGHQTGVLTANDPLHVIFDAGGT